MIGSVGFKLGGGFGFANFERHFHQSVQILLQWDMNKPKEGGGGRIGDQELKSW